VLAERMWERRNGKFRLNRQPITMKEFAAKWDEDYVSVRIRLGRMKESSAESCRSRSRLHIVPFFGQMRLEWSVSACRRPSLEHRARAPIS
jgi:hypothetical protein